MKDNQYHLYDSEYDGWREKVQNLIKVIAQHKTCGFNSLNYDLPILCWAAAGKTTQEIYELSKRIIGENLPWWKTLKAMNKLNLINNHYDIAEVCPGVMTSLKMYGARIHTENLQELPFDPHEPVNQEQIEELRRYCFNDVQVTAELYEKVKDRIELRDNLSKRYSLNLNSKSDAQIAETVMRTQVGVKKVDLDIDHVRYTPPSFIKFKSPHLQEVLKLLTEHEFTVNAKGKVDLPKMLKDKRIDINGRKYQMGVGGLHSCEKKQVVDNDMFDHIIDCDVTAYYPSIILNNDVAPAHFNSYEKQKFLSVYRGIVEERRTAKENGDDLVNQSFKIIINGLFGKMASPYSAFYSPEMFLFITLTGQLSLLMLIEMMESRGVTVLSANTDGVVAGIKQGSQLNEYYSLTMNWENLTEFDLEFKEYQLLASRDVNNYLAHIGGGNLKTKGMFESAKLDKSPQAPICYFAAGQFLAHGVMPEKTIEHMKDDFQSFITVRQVKGGAEWKGGYLGKVVRWVWGKNGEIIKYRSNGNKVAKSDGAIPCMDLSKFEGEIDYQRYIDEAWEVIKSVKSS